MDWEKQNVWYGPLNPTCSTSATSAGPRALFVCFMVAGMFYGCWGFKHGKREGQRGEINREP